ncbi:unnamed protein product [Vitrella brassicaformis CCMP3155]|uniref:EGF-like domain-containing protein n=1 Tax=Vitrella brassicaformis (strain CCMP3155) TaxID=1169540 RepID=A0A0G4E9M4_VITBC|nr:unnamed protein product [Vitrella brassicaformis CCMP3155]|eukprot:CEL92604.1 unnamed protein product [Vitrella brassicaformis CCMP3155]
MLPSVLFLTVLSSVAASSPLQRILQAANETDPSPDLPPGWRDPRRLKLLQLSLVFRPADVVTDDAVQRGDNILPYTEMEELVSCDSCREDAAALFEWSHEAGLAPNETRSIFEDKLCIVPFITCVRLSEALADGGPREGYLIVLTGFPGDREISNVPGILQQRRGRPLVFSDAFYRLRHVMCLWSYQVPMQGTLSDELSKVTSLRALVLLGAGPLAGPLPTTIGELSYLKGLYIQQEMHALNGSIPPSITSLPRLEALTLTSTSFSGSIPEDIGNLRRLRVLEIWDNKEMDGPFPASVTSCRNLTRLKPDGTGLSGHLPGDLGTLSRLDELTLANNELSGELPGSLVQLRRLRVLLLTNNRFSGPLPDGLGTRMDSLRQLDVSFNRFSGPVPASLGNAANLTFLSLERQWPGFSGPMPPELGQLSKLQQLTVAYNQLSGTLPDTLSGWRSVKYLDLRNNNFSGTLEPLSNLTSLEALRVSNNSFGGHLPFGFESFENLTRFDGSNNRLVGLVGRNLSGPVYESIRRLDVHSNLFELSPDLSVFPNLEYADLHSNLITGFSGNGSIPRSLRYLDLRDNRLTALPEGFRSMPSLETLYLANNRINRTGWPIWGRTPDGFCQLGQLNSNVMRQLLDPRVAPPDWGSLTDLDVSNNPINVDVTDFLMPLKWQKEEVQRFDIRTLDQGLSLSNAMLQTLWGFPSLASVHMRDNSITAIDTGGVRLEKLNHADFHNNSLVTIATGYGEWDVFDVEYARFTENPDLRFAAVTDTDIEDLRKNFSRMSTSKPLVPDPQGYLVRGIEGEEGEYECTEFCSIFHQIEVDDTFNSEKLCRCVGGYEGVGMMCAKCPPNKFSNRQIGTKTCKDCPDDAVSDEGSTKCFCPLAYEKRDDEPCAPCTAGSVGVHNSEKGGAGGSRVTWTCRDCLPGLNCSVPVNYNASVLPGFFQLTVQLQSNDSYKNGTREVTTYGSGLTLLPVVMRCPLPSACKGTNRMNGLNICSEGHEGFVCNRCKTGFSRHTPQQPCAPCAPLWVIVLINLLLIVATLIAIFILTALAERAGTSLRAEVPSQLIKIGLSHITAVCGLAFLVFDESLWGDEISSLVGPFFAWSGGVRKATRYGTGGFDRVRNAFRARRRVDSDGSTSLAADTHLRALSVPPSVTNGKEDETAAQDPRQRSVTFQENSRTEPVTPPSCQPSPAEPRKSGRWRQWLDNRGTMMVVILTFIHPTVTKSMLALLRCRPYPYVDGVTPIAAEKSVSLLPTNPMDDMRPRMDLDSHVICRSAEHAPFLWIAVTGLLLWTFSPVVCGVAFLWRHREGLQNYRTRRRVGFLYVGYRKNFYYWDAVLAMRRVLVLLIAQQATAQPRQQLLGWTVVAAVCLALQFAVWPFDGGSMDILNRTELRGLLVWLMSLFVMHFVVMLPEGTSLELTIGLVLVAIVANLVHYIMLAAQICRYGLLQVGYRYTALTDRKKAFARLMSGCVTGCLMSWLIRREEEKRRISPKVFYDWSSAALSTEGHTPAAAAAVSVGCHPSVGRPVHRVVTAMQLTSASVQDAVERLKLTHVPGDFHEFLWSHAFLVQSLRQRRVEMQSRRQGYVVVHLPRPDDREATGWRHMRTSDLSNILRNQHSDKVSTRLESGKLGASHIETQPADSAACLPGYYYVSVEVSEGITLHDLQANLCYVVDELVSREQIHQAALSGMADGSDLEKADTEASTDQQHTGGWRGLYEAFRKAKRTLIEKGSPPEAIPEIFASLAPTVVETPCGHAADDLPMTGSVSPVSSTQSHLQSDSHTAALTPPCHHLMRVDWHRLSSDEKDSVGLSVSAEAVYDAVAAMAACQHSSAAS